jgi:predicted protein tyrosine phosphatase
MNILYLSCHETLEYDELKLFTEMGHKVVSYGAYSNPKQAGLLRPSIPNLFFNEELFQCILQSSKDHLHDKLIEWADIIIVMHIDKWIFSNLERLKGKRVVWRSIGQSIPDIELRLKELKKAGVEIVRYSPAESRIRGYVGSDAMIRFYKDKEVFNSWGGKSLQVITIAQQMCHPGRKRELSYSIFTASTKGIDTKLYGLGNDCAGELWGGQLEFDEMLRVLRDSRCYFYTGTKPAPYTLGFIEAFMTGIPIVAIGRGLAYDEFYQQDTYEVADIISNGINGFVANTIEELHDYCQTLLDNHSLAKKISVEARNTAIKLFSKEVVINQWEKFL